MQLRRHYFEFQSTGAEVVAIGTGDGRYAAAFIADEDVPFPVLVDDDGAAARAASVRKVNIIKLATDRRMREAGRASHDAGTLPMRKGMRPGKRVTQLGATFVIGPGPELHFAHYDEHGADHPPIADVLAAVPRREDPLPGRLR